MVADPKEKMGMKAPFRYSVSLLRTYLKPQWLKVSLLAFLLFVSIGLEILGPQLLGQFIDSLQSSMHVIARESADHSRGAGKVPVELACQYS